MYNIYKLEKFKEYDLSQLDEDFVATYNDFRDTTADFSIPSPTWQAMDNDFYEILVSILGEPVVEEVKQPTSTKAETPKAEKKSRKKPTSKKELDKSELVILSKAAYEGSRADDVESDVMSIAEVISLYNEGITEDEIKAWVYYKRSFGVPMTGWEKYWIFEQVDSCIANKATMLKDNKFDDDRLVPKGANLGKLTKFEQTYGGTTWVIVKNEAQELLWVNKADVDESKNNNSVDFGKIKDLVEKRVLFFSNGDYLPYPIFSFGDMYERDRQLAKDKEFIINTFGEEIYAYHVQTIKDSKPKILEVQNPIASQRPFISVNSKLATTHTFANQALLKQEDAFDGFSITALNDELGLDLQSFANRTIKNNNDIEVYPFTLSEAFAIWVNNSVKDSQIETSTKYDIINYHVEGKNLPKAPKDASDKEKAELKFANKQKALAAKDEGDKLFSEFLATGLTFEDQVILNEKFNGTYNCMSKVKYEKVPVGFSCSRTFKNELLSIKEMQRNGVAFLNIVGSGCLAYDVGVGKTLTAIINIAQRLSTGEAKRALISVPDATIDKWGYELFGYYTTQGYDKSLTPIKNGKYVSGILSFTNIKFNFWDNLGKDVVAKLEKQKGGTLNDLVAENSITIVTHGGFNKIGFSQVVKDDLLDRFAEVLTDGGNASSARAQAIEESKFSKILGTAYKNTIIDIDVCGFDLLIVDEAHNFKNVFDSVGRDADTKRNLFSLSGTPSVAGVKLFTLSQYLNLKFGKAVILLTATPFTNSALEIFSMISFIGYNELKKYNLQNIRRFFETFVNETAEYVVAANNDLIIKPVIKSFKNKQILQRLLYNLFDYKTGEDAGVIRPCKVVLPMTKEMINGEIVKLGSDEQVSTYLDMNDWQIRNQASIVSAIEAAKKARSGLGIFAALSSSLNNALTPYLYAQSVPNSAVEFVEESPKIKYLMGCIQSVKDYHDERNEDVSGQVIYANRGKDYFPYMKEYLESVIGYERNIKFGKKTLDEVEIITSGVDNDDKEDIKNAFLAGFVKVIIGTSTIREGIDLQTKGTVIYNLTPDWTPTNIRQLEGRIWRQGNENGYVRIVNPLVKNSADTFVYQKLEEKQARLATIWDRTSDANEVSNEEQLDAEEIKYALITNPQVLAMMTIEKAQRQSNVYVSKAEDNFKVYNELEQTIRLYKLRKRQIVEEIERVKTALKTGVSFFSLTSAYLEAQNKIEKLDKETSEFLKSSNSILDKCNDFLLRLEATDTTDDLALLKITDSLNRSYFSPSYEFRKYFIENYNRSNLIYQSIDRNEIYVENPNYSRSDIKNEFFNFITFYGRFDFRNAFAMLKKSEREVLKPYGLGINDDISGLKTQLATALEMAKANKKEVESKEYEEKIFEEVKTELEIRKSINGNINEQVRQFAKLNILLSYKSDYVDKESCELPDVECCPTNGYEAIPEFVVVKPTEEESIIPQAPQQTSTSERRELLQFKLEIAKEMLEEDPENELLQFKLEIAQEMLNEID